ncbi:hypothetical protein ABKN59_002666 [Abortiporus biennis]
MGYNILSAFKHRSLTFEQEVSQDSVIVQSQASPQENNNNNDTDTFFYSSLNQATSVTSIELAEAKLIDDFHEAALQATMSDVERPRSIINSIFNSISPQVHHSPQVVSINDNLEAYASIDLLVNREDEGSIQLWQRPCRQDIKSVPIPVPAYPASPQDLQVVVRSDRSVSIRRPIKKGRGLGLVWERGSIKKSNRRQIQASHGTSLQLALRPELSVTKKSSPSNEVIIRPQLKLAVWHEAPNGAIRRVVQPKARQLLASASPCLSSGTTSSYPPSRLFIECSTPSSFTSTAPSLPITPAIPCPTFFSEANPLALKLGDFTIIK